MIGYKRIKSSVGLALYMITAKGFKSSYAWSYSPNLQKRPRKASHRNLAPSPLRRKSSLLNANSQDALKYQNGIIPKMITKQIVASGLLVLVVSLLCFDDALAASDMPVGKRYWSIMESSESKERIQANEALLDYAVGTINCQFYDNTGGNNFDPSDFSRQWRSFRRVAVSGEAASYSPNREERPSATIPKGISLDTREGAVRGLRWLVGSLNDPYSKYLTREELRQELSLTGQDGFLGIGAIVEAPHAPLLLRPQLSSSVVDKNTAQPPLSLHNAHRFKKVLSSARVSNLPVVTAVEPDSPAERSGLVVGDRIVAVGSNSFLGWSRQEVSKTLATKYHAQSYFGQAELTIAKPVYAFPESSTREIVIGYRPSRVHLPTKSIESTPSFRNQNGHAGSGGDHIVHYQLLSSSTGSIFDHLHSEDVVSAAAADDYKVGYIRLTRFSKASTNGYLHAVQELEAAGAASYILDLRNNYGGTFQDALLLASTLIRDPHAILCYTMNARGAFTPHEVEEYVVDTRYPGYLLSSEPSSVVLDQLHREKPKMFLSDGQVDWDPPSSYASIHEQVSKRGMRRISYYNNIMDPTTKSQLQAQKKIVLLINEGTASSAEVFAATLHDNFRSVALVGTKTYGKGLIQHTFPTPDGGGLRLTVAEYLTPSLQHVTHVGSARYDRETGEFLGGGLQPDVFCESKQGIPGNIGADLCLGIALDALEEANTSTDNNGYGISGESSQMMVKGFSWGWKPSRQER